MFELEHLVEVLKPTTPGRGTSTRCSAKRGPRACGSTTHRCPTAGIHAGVRDGAYRLVQEGLTNAMKHAAGSDVLVRLAVRARALEVEVRDSGAAAPSPLATPGPGSASRACASAWRPLAGVSRQGRAGGGWRLYAGCRWRIAGGRTPEG